MIKERINVPGGIAMSWFAVRDEDGKYWNFEANKAASRMLTRGHEHGLTSGYIVQGFQGTNSYGPVFDTRGEANRWLHAEYEHVKPTRNKKHEKILRNYPEPLMIVRVEQ